LSVVCQFSEVIRSTLMRSLICYPLLLGLLLVRGNRLLDLPRLRDEHVAATLPLERSCDYGTPLGVHWA
jgi:hypothetical protein